MAEKIDMRILYLTGNGFPRSATDPRGTFSFEHVRALRALGAEVTAVDLQADDFGEGRSRRYHYSSYPTA